MVKCACGCGQEVIGPVVGVPTGAGDFVAFIPEHHQGTQTPVAADGFAENPLTRTEAKKVDAAIRDLRSIKRTGRKMIRGNPFNPSMFVKERREHPSFSSAQIRRIVRDHRRMKRRGHRRNVLPVGQIAKLAGVKGSVKVGIGEKPGMIRCPECGGRGSHGRQWGNRLCGLCDGAGRITQARYDREMAYRASLQTPAKNADDGTINVHGSKITEVRYVEAGTGIPYKHKIEKPVKMTVRGGKVHIPPMTVKPEGITQ
jgi:hypothetical protein